MAMVRAHEILTQRGISKAAILPLAKSARVIAPIVIWASLAPCEKAMNLAITTATRGERARVDTDVAIALSVSWKALAYSNTSARATIAMRRTTARAQVSCA
jgi:hypothetical protein